MLWFPHLTDEEENAHKNTEILINNADSIVNNAEFLSELRIMEHKSMFFPF